MKRLVGFIKETRGELAKVSWPDRAQLMGSTWVVIVATVILTLFISACDLVLSQVMRVLLRAG